MCRSGNVRLFQVRRLNASINTVAARSFRHVFLTAARTEMSEVSTSDGRRIKERMADAKHSDSSFCENALMVLAQS